MLKGGSGEDCSTEFFDSGYYELVCGSVKNPAIPNPDYYKIERVSSGRNPSNSVPFAEVLFTSLIDPVPITSMTA